MSKGWIEWKGHGEVPAGYVDVMFRGGDIVEGYESDYWCWSWVTGESRSEIVAYRKHRNREHKAKHKCPEFTFDDGIVLLKWSHERNYALLRLRSFLAFAHVKTLDEFHGYIKCHPETEKELKMAQSVAHKLYGWLKNSRVQGRERVLKKLKLYTKHLQRSLTVLQSNKQGL